MEKLFYLPLGAAGIITACNLGFCLWKGRDGGYKKLVRTTAALVLVLLVRFAALTPFGLGWRCVPRNGLDLLWGALLVRSIWLSLDAFSEMEQGRGGWNVPVVLAAVGVELALLGWIFVSQTVLSWHDWTKTQNGQLVVVESNGHGTIGHRRAFLYVNSVVHGREVEYEW